MHLVGLISWLCVIDSWYVNDSLYFTLANETWDMNWNVNTLECVFVPYMAHVPGEKKLNLAWNWAIIQVAHFEQIVVFFLIFQMQEN